MSYVVEILRPILKEEILSIVDKDGTLSILEQGDNWIELDWTSGGEQAQFSLSQGRIAVTTPSEHAWSKAQELAGLLSATVVGEEDQLPDRIETERGLFSGRSTWIGWPILVVILTVALIWRW